MNDPSASAESKDPRIEAAMCEYLERLDRGEALDREEFFKKHAGVAQELRSFIDAEEQFRKLAAAGKPESRSTQSFALHGQETMVPRAGANRSETSGGSGLKTEFGRYRIVRALGKGAMGTVYLAEDTQLQRQVALKTPHFEQQPTPELLERFFREARAAATLRHANICPVFDVGQIDETYFISMAYIEGNPLSAFIKSGKPQPERQILLVVRKLAQALQEAHDHGVVHRDLKPANIMIDKRSEPIIMDFGLARQLKREANVRITQSGMLIGTPAYMSPEQVEGDPDKVGPPSDQFSLGVILYELLTGDLPFRGSLAAVIAQILTKEATPPSSVRPGLDPRIEAACLKMMAKAPADRFASLSAVVDELGKILRTPKAKPKPGETGLAIGTDSPAAAAGTRETPDASSRILKSPSTKSPLTQSSSAKSSSTKSLSGKDLVSLEELARKCLARRDYDQVIQIVERVPEEKRSDGLAEILQKSRDKADEIAFLICEIDEAVRFNDRTTALKKADELLKIKPGHRRALKLQEEFAGYGQGGGARFDLRRQFTQPWNEGGWVPWSVLAFGLAIFGVMTGVIVIQIGKTAVVIDVKDPGITVQITAKGNKFEIITGPNEQKVEVEPGEQELRISYAGLETRTKRFELSKGQKRVVTVFILNKEIVADLDHEPLPLVKESEKVSPRPATGQNAGGGGAKVVSVPKIAAKPPIDESAAKKQPAAAESAPAAPIEPLAPPSATVSADGFFPLFNGRDLTGWQTHPSQPGNWRVEDGVLIGSGSEASHLYTTRADFKDFDLRVEARINDRGNSGLIFRTTFGPRWPAKDPKFPFGYEAQIDNSNHKDKTGSLFVMTGGQGSGRAVVAIRKPLVPNGQWFRMEVIARRNHIVIKVEGREVAERDDSHFHIGHIALQQIEPQTVVEFRKVEIKELSPAHSTAPATTSHHFVPLFNGRDLSGWKTHPSQPGNWRVENGLLVGSGPGLVSHLYTDRGDFKDFHLRVEARFNEGGNSGIYYRTGFGPKFPAKRPRWLIGYNAKLDDKRLGAFLLDDGSPNGPLMVRTRVPEMPAGRWIVLEVTVRGNHIVIQTDGVITAEFTDEKRHFNSGYIALQQHTPQTRVEFRKIEIEELDSTAPDPSPEPGVQLTPTPGYVSLFNGRDLAGWETSTSGPTVWRVENGILSAGDAGANSFLYSTRGDYKDFDLRLEMRITGDASSDLWFRNDVPSPEEDDKVPQTGYKIDLREPTDARAPRTGSIWAAGRGPQGHTFNGYARHDKVVPPGQWFTLEVLARGTHTVVLVNGQGPTNLNWNKRDSHRAKGHIAIEKIANKDSVEFRRIEIKELGR